MPPADPAAPPLSREPALDVTVRPSCGGIDVDLRMRMEMVLQSCDLVIHERD
jgi:hypothetical protein